MIKLNISVCRKVSDANYGSNGASVALEIELDNSVFADCEQLRAAIQDLQLECDAAVLEGEFLHPIDEVPYIFRFEVDTSQMLKECADSIRMICKGVKP